MLGGIKDGLGGIKDRLGKRRNMDNISIMKIMTLVQEPMRNTSFSYTAQI